MKRSLPILGTLLALATLVNAQCNSNLTITGNLAPGQTLTVALTGASANDITLLGIGDAGSTTINLGMFGSLTLGLDSPFIVLPFGQTNASGAITQTYSIPSSIPSTNFPMATKTVQAVTIDIGGLPGPGGPPMGPPMPMLSFCVSNTATLNIG